MAWIAASTIASRACAASSTTLALNASKLSGARAICSALRPGPRHGRSGEAGHEPHLPAFRGAGDIGDDAGHLRHLFCVQPLVRRPARRDRDAPGFRPDIPAAAVCRQAPADEWLARLNKVREVAGADVELLPLQAALPALPHSRRAALLSGAIVIDVAGKSFYRRVDLTGARYIGSDADVIHAQKLPIVVGQALRMEAIRYAIVALFLLLPIGWWSRAHWRGLQALSRVADDFCSGDLAARATVRRTSSIAPLATRINEMAARIARLLDARKNLLHSVSHELRTPIARLEFGLELLRAAAPDPALAKRIEA